MSENWELWFFVPIDAIQLAVSPVTGWLYSSVLYSVNLLIIASSSVNQFPFLYWIVPTFPFLSVVRSVTHL